MAQSKNYLKTKPYWKSALILFFFSLSLSWSTYWPFLINISGSAILVASTLNWHLSINFIFIPSRTLSIINSVDTFLQFWFFFQWYIRLCRRSIYFVQWGQSVNFKNYLSNFGYKKTSFLYTKTKNGTVVVVGHNLHKINKYHSQSKSNRFFVLL